ncbi:hypothetical protein Pla22_26240 [Rubripirellula amarantea]|uniref:Uncharacterized protein n=1 Tax=Rubripirellula amarantea TaxID=2527999 RepID=A0A5C5WWK0_9BACT|nr:hypothetical protein [Rubripirellula amarantea]TWT54970.1 hypothetical protein Pla22_26240 [Rubripirellula amarantea]
MSNRLTLSLLLGFVALGGLTLSGCNSSSPTTPPTASTSDDHGHDDHDHDDHEGHDHGDHEGHDHGDHSHDFSTLGDAVAEVEELSGEIGAAFEKGDPESAHDALHHIGDVLGATEQLVKKSELATEDQAVATAAVENLFDSFAAIDEKMHGHDGSDFSEVKDTIESAIATLKLTAEKIKK